jgi:hypothetical protein
MLSFPWIDRGVFVDISALDPKDFEHLLLLQLGVIWNLLCMKSTAESERFKSANFFLINSLVEEKC